MFVGEVLSLLVAPMLYIFCNAMYLHSLWIPLKSWTSLKMPWCFTPQMLRFCDSDQCSFLDEIAADSRTMQLAEQVAVEVCFLFTSILRSVILHALDVLSMFPNLMFSMDLYLLAYTEMQPEADLLPQHSFCGMLYFDT